MSFCSYRLIKFRRFVFLPCSHQIQVFHCRLWGQRIVRFVELAFHERTPWVTILWNLWSRVFQSSRGILHYSVNAFQRRCKRSHQDRLHLFYISPCSDLVPFTICFYSRNSGESLQLLDYQPSSHQLPWHFLRLSLNQSLLGCRVMHHISWAPEPKRLACLGRD